MERKISIESEGIYREDYQIRMLKANAVPGFLKIQGQGVDGMTRYDYEVSGKVSMKAMYERAKLNSRDLELFLHQLLAIIKETEKYLLNIHCILLEPEYIFYEDETFYFCYYPAEEHDIWDALKQLADYFVKHADYKEAACVQMVSALHKGVLEENYSLEKLSETCMEAAKAATFEEWKQEKEQTDEAAPIYDRKEHDWIAEQEMAGTIMEETENLWTPVKRFLNRHRKPKWGDFDGLYIEEEEL
ncbi:hypothetical protein DWW31_16750 [Clostridium sp. AF15-17LB]|nr:hypothetical protein DWW31_16750 [Clostridium sp. AF15-17LB]